MTPRATYRFQFHRDFTFADAEALVPYLDRLGVSHVYASPITTARSGSTHGYDVVDPTTINPELGGEEAFRSLVKALRARDMGVIIDIVPNHMGVAGSENGWWMDVLAHGQGSAYARFFDIDWREPVLLPVLGTPLSEALEQGAIEVVVEDGKRFVSAYGEHRFPLRDEDQAGDAISDPQEIRAVLERQHYRLASWRTANDALNWRRFFTVSELAGLRIEDPEVFDAVHALPLRLYAEGLIDGVRVDHVDGLTDPAGYCRTLRARLDATQRPADAPPGPAYLVIEKILGAGEPLSDDWGVDGTSGYDFMEEVAALLHAPEGEAPLDRLWEEISGRPADFEAEELEARRHMLAWAFEGQLTRCVQAFTALAASTPETEGLTRGMLRRAIERLLWVFPVYRTYGTGDAAPEGDAEIREIARSRVAAHVPPGEEAVVDRVLEWLAGTGPGDTELAAEAVRRFQQLSAPIAAKAVEDTAFYRYGRLLSRNDVGFDATRFSASIAEFHADAVGRAERFPRGMLATATHDHKRGEDMRARLAVLSELPDAWREAVLRWHALAAPFADGVDPGDVYMLFQTLFGAWPDGLAIDDADGLFAFADRVVAWQQKALREAKLRSSWEAPNEAYEGAAEGLVRALLDPGKSGDFLADLQAFLTRTAAPARANSLAQVALRYTVPGVPDCYQGTELPDYSLVDPDNRRPVDYELRAQLLADPGRQGAEKLALIARLLGLRRQHPGLFASGDYRPVDVRGARADHVLAFTRTAGEERLLAVVALRTAEATAGTGTPTPAGDWWADTVLEGLPEGVETRVGALLCDEPTAILIIP
ncbi:MULTISPECIES: malto-oligosyltrehalose synthase [Sphingomonas]|uniref:malto-oligosyltrehalose synthase n=1 Tax=Sphingomonas TaxID=13687 RepID=UPI000F7F7C96|nr:malto-oligosyltrehalose synthase [Sphingomonas sp. ABOLF]RSV18032.1 malto-oligosyltrehalose synthase [Sphingomonas sp. ABOLF]GLK20833.1 malto-oligosyltrehalose synthase [Microbacterium terregens]